MKKVYYGKAVYDNKEINAVLNVLKKAKLTFSSRTIIMLLIKDFILKLILEAT